MADVIPSGFANSGDKIAIPEQQQSDGSVSMATGFGPFYELDLRPEANQPNAKAIRRENMNWILNQITENLRVMQQTGFAPWFANFPGGYPTNAMVSVQDPTTLSLTVFRSLIDSNTKVTTDATAWERFRTYKEILRDIPMPFGGPGGYTTGIIRAATDMNALTQGVWAIESNTVAATCSNTPWGTAPTTNAKKGIIESYVVDPGTSGKYGMQRYYDAEGGRYTRAYTGAAWLPWAVTASTADVQSGVFSYCEATGVAGANNVDTYTMSTSITPSFTTIREGTIFKVLIKGIAGNRGGTAQLKLSNAPAYPLLNCSGGNPIANTILLNFPVVVFYSNSKFYLMWCGGPRAQIQNIGLDTSTVPIGGIITWPVMSSIPKGYVKCNGASLSYDAYPALGALFGVGPGQSFVVMDTRGEFIRGWDDGRGVDPGRGIRTGQAEQMLAHNHTGNTANNGAHQHTGQTNNEGAHQHSGAVDANGNHNHAGGVRAAGAWRGDSWLGSNNDSNYGVNYTDDQGWHAHNMTTPADQGAHQHNFTTSWAGDHNHAFTTDPSGGPENRPRNVALQFVMRAQ